MASKGGSRFGYFLAGMGIGAVVAILFAPRSGEETREFLKERAEKGRGYLKEHSGEIRERAREYGEKGREAVHRSRESIESALEAGKRAYEEEKQKA